LLRNMLRSKTINTGRGACLAVAYAEADAPARVPLLGEIIGSFKSLCFYQWKQYAEEIDLDIASGLQIWQRNYFEHIIRNEKSLETIRDYIKINPSNWEKDRNNPKNL
jgi:putative transposase